MRRARRATTESRSSPTGFASPTTSSTQAVVDPTVDAAIDDAIAHLRAFNEQQLARTTDWSFESEPGLTVGEKITPIVVGRPVHAVRQGELPERHLPTGRAGDRRRRAAAGARRAAGPGSGGEVDPAVLVVCRKLGLRDVFRVNGPAGIAALGFGTESIPKVRKVVGPGSPAVTIAQVEMQRHGVTTMMLLGPTESVVIADDTADPERLAADLLIEAEHGTDTSVVLVTTSTELADAHRRRAGDPARRPARRARHGRPRRARRATAVA